MSNTFIERKVILGLDIPLKFDKPFQRNRKLWKGRTTSVNWDMVAQVGSARRSWHHQWWSLPTKTSTSPMGSLCDPRHPSRPSWATSMARSPVTSIARRPAISALQMSITAKRCWIHRRSTREPVPWPILLCTRDWRISHHLSLRACSRWKSSRQSNQEPARRTQPISLRNVSNRRTALQAGPIPFSEADERAITKETMNERTSWDAHTLKKHLSYLLWKPVNSIWAEIKASKNEKLPTTQQTNYSKFTTNFQTLIKIYYRLVLHTFSRIL